MGDLRVKKIDAMHHLRSKPCIASILFTLKFPIEACMASANCSLVNLPPCTYLFCHVYVMVVCINLYLSLSEDLVVVEKKVLPGQERERAAPDRERDLLTLESEIYHYRQLAVVVGSALVDLRTKFEQANGKMVFEVHMWRGYFSQFHCF